MGYKLKKFKPVKLEDRPGGKRIIKKILVIGGIAVGSFAVIMLIICLIIGIKANREQKKEKENDEKGISTTQWFWEQSTYFDNISLYSENVDDAVTLYLKGDISSDDFKIFVNKFYEQYYLMLKEYEQKMGEHKIDYKTVPAEVEVCCNAIYDIYKLYGDIINSLKENSENKERLTYQYLAYQQTISSYLNDFMIARATYYGRIGLYDNYYNVATPDDAEASDN